MKLRYFGIWAILLFVSGTLWAQDGPITDEFNFLKSGMFANPSSAPNLPQTFAQRANNPAALADLQSQVFHVHYATFIDSAGSSGLVGHAGGVGFLTPLPAGTLGLSLDFASLASPGFADGSWVELGASYSNDIAPGLNFGAAIRSQVGGVSEIDDFSIFLDLALKHWFTLDDTTQAIIEFGISGIGKELVFGNQALESAFTPWAAFGTSLGDENVSFGPTLAVSAPTFQNLRIQAGLDFSFFSVVDLRVQSSFDLAKTIAGENLRSLIPGFTLAFRIPMAENSRAVDDRVSLAASAALWTNDILSVGLDASIPAGNADRTVPAVVANIPEVLWISPNNDGVQDRFEVPVTVTDVSPLTGLAVRIVDASGETVVTQERQSIPEEITDAGSFFRALFGEAAAVVPEQTFPIDARLADGGTLPDGTYSLVVEATDRPGNKGTLRATTFTVDTLKPDLMLAQPSPEARIFSPNGDGQKDTFVFELETSREALWTAQVQDASGSIVKTFTETETSLSRLEWDGTADDGNKLPDGVYEFSVSSTDEAGNRNSAQLTNIILNSIVSPVGLQTNGSAFSPNGDSSKDTLRFTTELSKREGASSWEIRVLDGAGNDRRVFRGNGAPPASVDFDGRATGGAVLPEGLYSAELAVTYTSGNVSRAKSPAFEIDVTAPYAEIAKEFTIFSPDGNGERDTMLIYQEGSEEELWTGTVYDNRGTVVFSQTWSGEPGFRFEWDGLSNDTATLPNGDYDYVLAATDPAGNSFRTTPVRFTLDTSQTLYFIGLSTRAFSPNADGVKDGLEISIEQRDPVQVAKSEVQILDSADRPIRRFTFTNQAPQRLVWDGKTQDGTPAPDGQYRVKVEVNHLNGTSFTGTSGQVTLDTVFPRLAIRAADTIFSPNGDGNKDTLRILPTSSDEDLITVELVNAAGSVVHSRTFRRTVEAFDWDGKNISGNLTENGYYLARIRATDAAGNASQAQTDYFTLDTRVASAFITLGARGLAPNGDEFFEDITFGLYLNLLEGLETWKLEIRNQENAQVRTFTGTRAQEQFSVTWDGKNNAGQVVPGTYKAVFSAKYTKGDSPESTSGTFVLDTAGPQLRLVVAPLPFSPDNDGVDDEVGFDIRVNDPSGISVWALRIYDRSKILVQEYRGEGEIESKLYWNGITRTGERVLAAEDYTYELQAYDSFGNFNKLEGTISTDIFVVRQGDKLYIQIASMSFLPNSPSLVLDQNDPIGLRNSLVLSRLVDLFARYPSYKITIEGHAVNITGTEAEQTRELVPLSLRRAQSVRDALIARGMDPGRISTVGIGGARPLVPHSDAENRWKNRRVEFILEK